MAQLKRDKTILKGMRAIELFRDGYTPAEIAKAFGYTYHNIFKVFKSGGGRSPDDFKAHHEARQRRKKKIIVEV